MSKSKARKNTPKDYFLAYIPAFAWAVVIFLLSAQEVLPGFTVSAYDFIFKKSAHMFVYAVLYWLLSQAYQRTTPTANPTQKALIPLLMVLCYAITDELHQGTVPGRYPTVRDVGYDLLGATTVLLHQLKLI